MNYTNYIKIDTDNLKANLNYLENNYNYKYFILDVSNNAYSHGMYLIKYLPSNIYLYINNFNDLLLARKYNKEVPIIYAGEITLNNIYDLIINNAILLIKSNFILKKAQIDEKIDIILNIDTLGFNGISSKQEINEVLEIINTNEKINLLGIMSDINSDNYLDFCELTINLPSIPLYILNNEKEKCKIKQSNAIKLDKSIYGINSINKKKIFKKEEKGPLKQVFTLYTHITKINTEITKKKEKITGSIPLGSLNGLNDLITYVQIHNTLYKIIDIYEEYSLIEIDKNVNLDDPVIITGPSNPLENYFAKNTLNYFNLFSNLPIIYNDYTLEKTFIY